MTLDEYRKLQPTSRKPAKPERTHDGNGRPLRTPDYVSDDGVWCRWGLYWECEQDRKR